MKGAILTLLALAVLVTECSAFTVTRVRLLNGPRNGHGRVEIQVDGTEVWGSICTKGFDWHEATVICRMLGFTNNPGVIDRAITTGIYGHGDYNFLMNNVTCQGSETSVGDCASNRIIDCKPGEDHEAAVECRGSGGSNSAVFASPNLPAQIVPIVSPDPSPDMIHAGNCTGGSSVRIYGRRDTPGMGYLQVQDPLTGIWGFVCDDKWSLEGAKVACKQMCYGDEICPRPGILPGYLPDPQNPNIILDDVNCTGSESRIQDCKHRAFGGNNNDCLLNGGELAGIQCRDVSTHIEFSAEPYVECSDEEFKFIYPFPSNPALSNLQIHIVNEPGCTQAVRTIKNDRLILSFPFYSCGTKLSENITHLLYTNQVEIKWISTDGHTFDRYRNNQYKIKCAADRFKAVTQRFQPFTLAPVTNITNSTDFDISFKFFVNAKCDEEITANPFYVEVGKIIYAAIELHTSDDRLKLVTTDCSANPVGNPGFKAQQDMIRDKCPVSHFLQSTTLYPLNITRQGMRFRAFKFIGYSLVYLHCEVIICRSSQNTDVCDRTCRNEKPSVRRKRSIDEIEEHVSVTSQAIIVVGDDSAAAKGSKILTPKDLNAPAEELPLVDETFEEHSNELPTYVMSDREMALDKMNSIRGSGNYITASMVLLCGLLLLHIL